MNAHLHSRPRRSDWIAGSLLLGVAGLLAGAPTAAAGTVAIGFDLETGTASASPFEFAIPGTDTIVTVAPGFELDSGSLAAQFGNASALDMIHDGPMAVASLTTTGRLTLTISDTIQIGPFPIEVEAVIAGPIAVAQTAPATGLLVDGGTFVETSPGTFDLSIGPLTCSDNALGVVCGSLATGLGLEFPLEQQVIEGTALPIAGGLLENLDSPGLATIENQLELTLPIDPGGEASITFQAEFVWMENARELVPVPEPDVAAFAGPSLALVVFLAGRRRRQARGR